MPILCKTVAFLIVCIDQISLAWILRKNTDPTMHHPPCTVCFTVSPLGGRQNLCLSKWLFLWILQGTSWNLVKRQIVNFICLFAIIWVEINRWWCKYNTFVRHFKANTRFSLSQNNLGYVICVNAQQNVPFDSAGKATNQQPSLLSLCQDGSSEQTIPG